MPPLPKHSSARARRNKTSTNAILTDKHDVKAPPLPEDVDWHPMTRAWWEDIWASPMAPEYVKADQHGLFRLARLTDDFWTAETSAQRSKLGAEIRQQSQCFGLSPIDRRRLQWEIEKAEDARERGAKRRPRPQPTGAEDPRSVLRAVSS